MENQNEVSALLMYGDGSKANIAILLLWQFRRRLKIPY